jgi:hypothetical protein
MMETNVRDTFFARAVFSLLALLAISACASFNDPDDDPSLCQNGRHPKPNGECPNPLTLASSHTIASLTFPRISQ